MFLMIAEWVKTRKAGKQTSPWIYYNENKKKLFQTNIVVAKYVNIQLVYLPVSSIFFYETNLKIRIFIELLSYICYNWISDA